MERIVDHFTQNADLYKNAIGHMGKAVVGFVMTGITLGCLNLIVFLAKILRLPKTSREYMHKREHT